MFPVGAELVVQVDAQRSTKSAERSAPGVFRGHKVCRPMPLRAKV